jgi:ATP-dependent Clp protease protease subunit
MNSMSRLFLRAFVATLALSSWAQQPVPPQPPERVIINFILPITADSVNLLLSVVNAQVRNGAKKITIALSSVGGDPASAFAAYNILRNVNAEITTFNVGNVDSAALLIYCAGKHRYSLPGPTRFLIHGTSLNPLTTSVPVESRWIESQLAQLRSLDQVIVQTIAANCTKKPAEIEEAVHGQTILSPQEAKEWGIVEEIRNSFMEPGAVFVSVNTPPQQQDKGKSYQYTADSPPITSRSTKK